MKLQAVSDPSTFWDVNMADPDNLHILHNLTGHAGDAQRVLFRTFLRQSGCRTMLDCGAGPGWEYDGLRETGMSIKYTGLEITDLFLEHLSAKGVTTIKASVEDIPAGDDSYDLVYVRQVLEHVEKFQQALREMIRVARKFVYVAMNKDFGSRTVIKKQHGLWHNIYSMNDFRNAVHVDKMRELQALGLKSYLIRVQRDS